MAKVTIINIIIIMAIIIDKRDYFNYYLAKSYFSIITIFVIINNLFLIDSDFDYNTLINHFIYFFIMYFSYLFIIILFPYYYSWVNCSYNALVIIQIIA